MKRLESWLVIQIKNHWLFIIIAFLILACAVLLALSCKRMDLFSNCEHAISTAAGLTTIISLVLVYEGLRRTRIAAEAQLLSTYNDKYFENNMLNAIRALRKLSDEHTARFQIHRTPENNPAAAPGFAENKDFTWTSEEDMARRKVKAYFVNALDLYERDMLSYGFFIDIINKDAITTLFDVVEPLEWYLNKQYDAAKFNRLMGLAAKIYEERNKGNHQNDRVKDEEPTTQTPLPTVGTSPAKSYAIINIGCFNQRH